MNSYSLRAGSVSDGQILHQKTGRINWQFDHMTKYNIHQLIVHYEIHERKNKTIEKINHLFHYKKCLCFFPYSRLLVSIRGKKTRCNHE